MPTDGLRVMETHLDVSEYIHKLHCSRTDSSVIVNPSGEWRLSSSTTLEDNIFNAKVFHGDRLLAEAMATTRRSGDRSIWSAWNIVTVKETNTWTPCKPTCESQVIKELTNL
jgi:hypothetical protein